MATEQKNFPDHPFFFPVCRRLNNYNAHSRTTTIIFEDNTTLTQRVILLSLLGVAAIQTQTTF